MCYKKPGPRCSRHAYKQLTKAIKNLHSIDIDKPEERFEAKVAVRDAYLEYNSTPAGIEALKDTMIGQRGAKREETIKAIRDGNNRRSDAMNTFVAENTKHLTYNEKDAIRRHGVQERGRSCLACKNCGEPFSDVEASRLRSWRTVTCTVCREPYHGLAEVQTKISSKDQELLNADKVKQRKWYHATQDPNWVANINNAADTPVVHLGSMESAHERIAHLVVDNDHIENAKWYVYELKINKDTEVGDNILDDGAGGCPSKVKDCDSTKNGYSQGVTRYVNQYENPGSISLAANPKAVSIAGRKEITPLEAEHIMNKIMY